MYRPVSPPEYAMISNCVYLHFAILSVQMSDIEQLRQRGSVLELLTSPAAVTFLPSCYINGRLPYGNADADIFHVGLKYLKYLKYQVIKCETTQWSHTGNIK